MTMSKPNWQALINEKRAFRESQIPLEWRLDEMITSQAHRDNPISAFDLLDQTDILTQHERDMTENYDATALLAQLACGAISSLEVTEAFCKRAAIAHQLFNPLTEIFFDKALNRAKQLDAFLAREGKPMGPFHGLPISLKDTWMVKGEAATLGFVAYLTKPVAEENSPIVDILLDGGAVLYCKTNVPQGLFTLEGENNVFGLTMNPHKLTLGTGGSSSGEGALVGFRGSPLGLGTDIGGSIRVPSHVSGCYGFKPTANRIPFAGQQFHFRKGWPGMLPSAGPHANSARDLMFFCRTIISKEGWKRDSASLAIPWKDVRKKKLKIGFWQGAHETPVFPPVLRALRKAAEVLEAAGHEIVPVSTPEGAGTSQCLNIYVHSLGFDTKATLMKFLDDAEEEILPGMKDFRNLMADIPKSTLDDVWKFYADRADFRTAWHTKFTDADIDVLLCPCHQGTGMPHSGYGLPIYAMIWNLLDCPASVVPFLRSNKNVDSEKIEGFDTDAVDGAPTHVQVVGWSFRDEEVLMATEVISDALEKFSVTNL
ncbi:amidase signature domain-containing protein [Penicillium hordei]|uniref:amidase n=1 Tax=Penicillium hordei TaxID=40994 RepID=A0AAD6DKP5_9EURO|nr:amidase signature domain-containing protein [Penicillium hordei]KAJ5588198.1 amidase signature domain-containing protein [Penicillium hordei]